MIPSCYCANTMIVLLPWPEGLDFYLSLVVGASEEGGKPWGHQWSGDGRDRVINVVCNLGSPVGILGIPVLAFFHLSTYSNFQVEGHDYFGNHCFRVSGEHILGLVLKICTHGGKVFARSL